LVEIHLYIQSLILCLRVTLAHYIKIQNMPLSFHVFGRHITISFSGPDHAEMSQKSSSA